ncbi:MAG: hypothetical protein P4M12_05045 [Gammaproteobacteria bacterium]|nr:hypothetical protein [Gammaproteobacteria bacterium]
MKIKVRNTKLNRQSYLLRLLQIRKHNVAIERCILGMAETPPPKIKVLFIKSVNSDF